jgi:hypothetical protein
LENLSFLRSKTFARYYSIITNAVLSLSLVFSLLAVQNIAGIFVVLGVGFLFGQILLVLNLANKNDRVGWILVRFSYLTLFVVILGMLSIVVGTLIASFYFLGGNSLQTSAFFSSVGLTSLTCFGICLSGICYHTLSLDEVWNV